MPRRVTRAVRRVNTVPNAPVGAHTPRSGGPRTAEDPSMITWLLGSAIRLRWLVVAAVVAILGFGVVRLQSAPVDVYPEFQATQVEVQAEALGLSAQEVEQL